ncbi:MULTISPECIES: MHYT domain-containing protein [Alcaligenes]|jgi:PAS domain S-box-containing protein|uniref:histidine kinase n=1 Tax=Alcaligenes ammonioxydans TaxID=2582914 RepID=A0ABX8SRP4_9BURK|nr:MHYT domain-containing protein [Alcaligenes ammonioxydans]QXX78696.1 PAS domain S-box protein [Alcaligenes ammonioxydans]
MRILDQFFISADPMAPLLVGSYNSGLVILSLLVAIFSSGMALHTAHIARMADLRLHRQIAICTGAIALGGGIWTMHFIGMLAFELCTSVHYDPAITMLSVLPSVGASWVALQILSQARVQRSHLIIGGVLVGLGIGTMHYSGMAAMRMAPLLRYEPVTFFLSIGVAVILATLALWIRFRLHRTRLTLLQRVVISGIVLGLAISGMHYTGMAAARFIGQTTPPDDLIIFNSTFASMVLSTFTITVTVLVAAANGLLRYRQLFLKMEESESHNRAIVDTAIDGIITISSNGTILDFNHSAERLFGWKAGEVLGRNVNMLMPEPDRSRHDSYLSNYLRSNDPKVIGVGRDVTGLRKDGSLMPMRLAVGRVRQPGDPIFVGFVTDMSRYNALTESLRQSAEKAEQAAQAKSAFLANMSHEIRTPLNAIIGFSDLMLNDALTAQQSKHLNIINQSARSLLALLNDILDTTKLERGSVELEQVDFSLIDLCQQVVASLRLAADAKNLEFRLSCAPELHPFYKGDPMRIQQVLNNLIGNAIKFTQSGAVRVEVNPEPGRNAVSIRVTDTGIGMSPEQLRHVFTPFTQADVSISRRFGGTGLGVSIARQLVDLMGGTLEVQSTLGVGSVFEVRIPLEPGNEPCLSPENQAVPHLPPLRILVADDINLNQELLTLTLEQHGHSVTATDSGHKVLELLDKEDFDVVLLDVHMPELDGLETARRWREQERREARLPLPLIALTASVMESDRHAAQEAGINGFATKPLDLPALMQEIARVMGLATTSSPDDSVEPQKSGLIDWDLGLSLWGSPVRLRRALLSFLSDLHTRYPLDEIKQASPNWEVVLGSLHGIRGTAGNLGLPQVSLLSAELEEKIRRGQTRQMRGRIEQLQDMFNRIAQELSHHGPPAPYTDSQAGVVHSPDVVLNYLHILHSSVQLNELDEPALQAICQYLESTGQSETLNNLNKTIDLFDFVQASSILTALITELNASLAKDPPRHE